MRKSTLRCIVSIFPVILVLCILLSATIYADSIADLLTDDATRWTNLNPSTTSHMGTKNTTYSYASSTVKNNYSSYVSSGIALWGSRISCTESSSSMGTITVSALDSNANATLTPSYSPATKHMLSWTLTIYSKNFDGNTDAGKKNTIAHEIGHAYGLGHVDYSNQIMYHTYSETKGITSYDVAGMQVMTHAHTHKGSYSKAFEQYSAYKHKVRCTTCKAYSIDTCTYSDYHSGAKHYLEVNCTCGNKRSESWNCSGSPCIMPFSSVPTPIVP